MYLIFIYPISIDLSHFMSQFTSHPSISVDFSNRTRRHLAEETEMAQAWQRFGDGKIRDILVFFDDMNMYCQRN